MFQLIRARDSDLELTFEIKKQSILPYVLELWGWDEELQRQIHENTFIPSEISLIHYKDQTVGLTVIKETEDHIFVQNLLIVNEFQNLGIGQQLMDDLIAKSRSEQKPIRLQVFKINKKAQKFYRKLGFEAYSETENHIKMIREI